jgi:hypothetical protein
LSWLNLQTLAKTWTSQSPLGRPIPTPMAESVAGLDSWIHHSRIKCWNPPMKVAHHHWNNHHQTWQLQIVLSPVNLPRESSYSSGNRLLLLQISDAQTFLGLCCLWNSHNNCFQCGTIFHSPL